LGVAGSDLSVAYGINNVGLVVGNGGHATIWNGAMVTDLGIAGCAGCSSVAYGINETGQVAGTMVWMYQPGGLTATIWNGATPTALSSFGLSESVATGINDAGQVVGYAGNTDTHAIIWNGTTPTDLSALNGNAGAAQAINNLGQVVGNSYPPGVSGRAHATIWNGAMPTDLGTLGGLTSYAYGINNAGQVVGWSTTGGTDGQQAFIWAAGTMTGLGFLPNSSGNIAYNINDASVVVGTSGMNVGQAHATIWYGGIPSDLNTLVDSSGAGWTLVEALAINNNGKIAGWGFNGAGKQRAFLLTPASALQVSPGTNIAASGTQGEAFSPASFQYQLSSTGNSINYSISGIPTWLNASFTSGTATATPVTVTFSLINPGSLGPGTFTANIAFSNTSNGEGNTTRTATLVVNAGTKNSCINGGWHNYIFYPGPFKSQGECVSYFAS
jgi:probable HAF family extracellular repeat protein